MFATVGTPITSQAVDRGSKMLDNAQKEVQETEILIAHRRDLRQQHSRRNRRTTHRKATTAPS